jgi:SPP1 family predicted phage head-tail adaptor
MDAGKLDRRVTLQRQGVATDDGFQSVPGAFADLAEVWAQFIPLTATERAQAGETQAYAQARYRIRKDTLWADLNAKDRLVDGRTFNITAVNEPDRDWLVIECVARADG